MNAFDFGPVYVYRLTFDRSCVEGSSVCLKDTLGDAIDEGIDPKSRTCLNGTEGGCNLQQIRVLGLAP